MVRRFGLIHATALNMTNMIGIGPFITIPLLMSALGGPQAMLGWLVALVIVICDGMVWSELGAAMPGSGGSFGYLRQGYGAEKVGRLMGYSRVPYAAAKDGYFFKVFARLHPSKGFPNVSLVVLGVLSILAGFVSLGMVIDALITTRILVQFIGQIGAVTLLRRRAPDLPRPYRMWLYPLPSLVALLGWIFIFATTPPAVIAFGLGALLLGAVCFGAWSLKGRTWPFEARRPPAAHVA